MSIPLVAAAFFGANIDKTCRFLKEYGYMPTMISKGRFNHRLHKIDRSRPLARAVFAVGRVFQKERLRANLRGGLFSGGGMREHPH
jgi:hypothetical protein